MEDNNSNILLYQTADGRTKIEVQVDSESNTVWLTQQQMVELFQRDKSGISRHIKNIFEEGELDKNQVVANFATTASDDKIYQVEHYNLDVIISVGYRIKSHRGTQFRIWATKTLKEYLIKGFVLDDQRFKSGKSKNYFDELLARIRDIRTSERMFYQKVKDIYITSIDYDANAEQTLLFYKKVQNKLLWAVSQKTAAEIVSSRSDAEQVNMGLKTWKNAPKGKIRKADVSVSKNYLNERELKELNLLVEQFLAFAEAQAMQQKPMYMKDWINRLNAILTLNEKEVLSHAGQISAKMAKEIAAGEYDKYKEKQKAIEAAESLKELENDLKQLNTPD